MLCYNMYKGRQYCIAKFRTVYIDGFFFNHYSYCFMCKPSQSLEQAQNIENLLNPGK